MCLVYFFLKKTNKGDILCLLGEFDEASDLLERVLAGQNAIDDTNGIEKTATRLEKARRREQVLDLTP